MSSPPPPALSVRVPASTSNLGPGFDFLGLALSLHLEVRATPLPSEARGHELARSGEGAAELGDDDDLVLRAFERAADELSIDGFQRFETRSDIPIGRGFGSSGAAVVAGLLIAMELAPESVERDRLLPLGIELEGHPDNVTASLFGGCTLCHPSPDGRPAHISNPIGAGIGFAIAWPAEALATERARAALPKTVDFADAVENPRRLALLLEGLRTGDARLLAIGGEDHLHVAHRLPLIAGASRALAAARKNGAWLATISGAGSGLVALGPHGRVAEIAAAMQEALIRSTGSGTGRVVEPVLEPPRVLRD